MHDAEKKTNGKNPLLGLIPLAEYAQKQGRSPVAARRLAADGAFKTAVKAGRNWMIDPSESWPEKGSMRAQAEQKTSAPALKKGLVHLYWGDGKGKTTAAMGLACRALGRGLRVVVMQFLKSGDSGELEPLRALGAAVFSGEAGTKFVFQMTPAERVHARDVYTQRLREALAVPCDLLVLDEACAAWQLDMVDGTLLKDAVLRRPQECEVVLTGREPADWMQACADYSTQMCCCRHPYDAGVPARCGVEF